MYVPFGNINRSFLPRCALNGNIKISFWFYLLLLRRTVNTAALTGQTIQQRIKKSCCRSSQTVSFVSESNRMLVSGVFCSAQVILCLVFRILELGVKKLLNEGINRMLRNSVNLCLGPRGFSFLWSAPHPVRQKHRITKLAWFLFDVSSGRYFYRRRLWIAEWARINVQKLNPKLRSSVFMGWKGGQQRQRLKSFVFYKTLTICIRCNYRGSWWWDKRK